MRPESIIYGNSSDIAFLAFWGLAALAAWIGIKIYEKFKG